jgi:hypothetical protein
MDLCASAVYRLAGGTPRPDREFTVRQWFDGREKNPPWEKTPEPLGRWLRSFKDDDEWTLALQLRDAYTHRTTRRHITITVGQTAKAFVDVDGTLHGSAGTMARVVTFGLERYEAFAFALRESVGA